MQTKDLTIGTEYVVSENWQWKRGIAGLNMDYGVKRVRVIEKGADRTYFPRDSFRPRTKADGILVVLLDTKTGEPVMLEGMEAREVIAPRDFRMEWAEFAEVHAEATDRSRRQAAERLAARQSAGQKIGALLGSPAAEALPYEVRDIVAGKVHADGSYSTEVHRMSLSTLTRLLEMAYEAGKKEQNA